MTENPSNTYVFCLKIFRLQILISDKNFERSSLLISHADGWSFFFFKLVFCCLNLTPVPEWHFFEKEYFQTN